MTLTSSCSTCCQGQQHLVLLAGCIMLTSFKFHNLQHCHAVAVIAMQAAQLGWQTVHTIEDALSELLNVVVSDHVREGERLCH